MFKDIAVLFQRYQGQLQHQHIAFNNELATEVKDRLEQLDFILGKVPTLEIAAGSARNRASDFLHAHAEDLQSRGLSLADAPYPKSLDAVTRADFVASKAAMFELRLLTEAFYYFAARVWVILTKSSEIPGLETFTCKGVRDVRNHLLEHPEGKSSRVWSASFGFGGPGGPRLKPSRSEATKHVFPDRGLYVNAEEFRRNLDAVLRRQLQGLE